MKFRLVELLQCVRCQGPLDVAADKSSLRAISSGESFSCRQYCGRHHTTVMPSSADCADCNKTDIESGFLKCRACGHTYRIVDSIPWLVDEALEQSDRRLSGTVALYSHLWTDFAPAALSGKTHLDEVEGTLGESVVQGRIGLDAGSGSGEDTLAMASRHPCTEIVSLDISKGVYEIRRRTAELPNVHVVRASVLSIPLKPNLCDFVYSFGVLHHTTNPKRGLQEIVRVLKAGGPTFLYLYEDHEDNPWKAFPLKLVTALRQVTTRMNPKLLSAACYVLSPFVVLVFSLPAKLLGKFRWT
ncbi:MAG: methyltransferase domain-containing protein, partial [Nitrospirae bacterium]